MAGGINIATLFATIGADTSGLQSGLGKAKTALEGFGGSIAKQILGVASLTAAIAGVGKFISSAVTDWVDYADSMRLSAQLAGITTEEMSRLAQAADDFRVPVETMQRSMELALKNGFLPTIENIALLSDELLAISDPAQRAAIASKIFGKSYADMMPFLLAGGDAIRSGTAAIAENLVVTNEEAAAAKGAKDSVDEFSDAYTGLKNNIGKAVTPAAVALMKKMSMSMAMPELKKSVGDNVLALQQLGQISAEEARKINLDLQGLGEGVSGKNLEELTTYYQDLFVTTSTSLATAKEGHDAYAAAISGTAAATADLGVESVLTKAKVEAITQAYEDQKKVLEEGLIDAQLDLNVSISTFRQGVASDLVQGLKDAGLEGEELISRLEILDKYAGTSYSVEYKMELAIPDLLKTLIEDPDSAAAALAAFDDVFMPMNASIMTAQGLVDDLQAKLDDLEKQYDISINIVTTGSLPNAPADNWSWSGGGSQTGLATGGVAFGDTPYIVGERGPELFIPDSAGRIVSNDKMAAMGQTTTNNYVLNMPTTANAGDVKMAFELMEAWA